LCVVDGVEPWDVAPFGPTPSLERLIKPPRGRKYRITLREGAGRSCGPYLIASFPLGLIKGFVGGQQETSGIEPNLVGRCHTHA
jgi:hypothetical protein